VYLLLLIYPYIDGIGGIKLQALDNAQSF